MALDPLPPFASHLPVRVRFGDGVIAELPGALGATHPLAFVDAAGADLAAVRAALPGATAVRTVGARGADDRVRRRAGAGLSGHDAAEEEPHAGRPAHVA